MNEPTSREHEPSGFGRVFGPLVATVAAVALAWSATRGRDRDPVTARRREPRRARDGRQA